MKDRGAGWSGGVGAAFARWGLSVYKWTVSPVLHAVGGVGGACRFQPTCSEYAAIAWQVHGPWRGSWLAVRRLLRCQPLARGGFDPVPPKREQPETRGF